MILCHTVLLVTQVILESLRLITVELQTHLDVSITDWAELPTFDECVTSLLGR